MEKAKSSKSSREERDNLKYRTRDGDDNRSSRDFDRHHRSDRDSKRELSHEPRVRHRSRRSRSPEPSYDREESKEMVHDRESKRKRSRDHRSEREGSRDRAMFREPKSERSEDHEEKLIERRHKRKERGESEDIDGDGGQKRTNVSQDKRKERRRFGDEAVEDGNEANGSHSEVRKFEDRQVKDEEEGDYRAGEHRVELKNAEVKVKKEGGDEQFGNSQGVNFTDSRNGPVGNVVTLDLVAIKSRSVPENSVSFSHSLPTKVSMISTTHENKGVSITGSHEVHEKSSTDGASSTAGKSGSLSLDAIAKAKKALQIQKELSEKLKKLKKGAASSSSYDATILGTKEGLKTLSTSDGAKHGSVPSTTSVATAIYGTAPNSSTLPTTSGKPPTSGTTDLDGLADIPSLEAVKRAQELGARMGFRQDPQFPPIMNIFLGQTTNDVAISQKPTKAPVLRLDALGREIDEHGNVVNVTKPNNLSTLKVNINKQKKEAFQILKPDMNVDAESNPHFDPRMGVDTIKLLRPKRMNFMFVEEGKWSREAEHMKLKSKFGEVQAKEQKAKLAQLAKAKAKAAPDINPNFIEVSERVVIKEKPKEPIPEVEWWDVNLLQSGTYGDTTAGIIPEDRLKLEKMTIYVEHPRPIEPPAEPPTPPPQPLKLTVKERKKLRTQRRLQREKDRQEMIRQGLLEPPKPKVKMSNMMKVLGSEATQDPTKLEMEIRSAAAEREQAHVDRNAARKLTPAERREKKERKLFDDPTTMDTIVTVFKINELSHPKARFKVDVNARENRLPGCAVISDGINVVVVEGGNKSIKRYGKLMLRRIDWASTVKDDEMDEDTNDEDKPPNKCVLVWQGSVAKPAFHRFSIHECMNEAAPRKIFADAGVGHYWDFAVNFSDDQM